MQVPILCLKLEDERPHGGKVSTLDASLPTARQVSESVPDQLAFMSTEYNLLKKQRSAKPAQIRTT